MADPAGQAPHGTMGRYFRQGFIGSIPFQIIVVPFGALFGVVATEAGLNLLEVMSFSVLMVAGAAQLTAIHLMTENAPVLLVLAASLAVNLRTAMYSAALLPYFGEATLRQRMLVAYLCADQPYAMCVSKFEAEPDIPLKGRLLFFAGVALPTVTGWYIGSLGGAIAGAGIPDSWALDFALPIMFIAIVAPSLRTLPQVATATSAVILSLLLVGLPSGVGLLVAGILAMAIGAAVEKHLADKKLAAE